ncbi:MAG: alpha/beta hydrolase [Pseudomonadota bacterium]
MSPRLWLLTTYMRLVTKRKLARLSSPWAMRADLERLAACLPAPPAEARFTRERIAVADEDGPRSLEIEWCAWDRADRRRAVLYLHGGAFICGSARTHRSLVWPLARASGARIGVLDYRRAPEHKFPAAFRDALAAWRALTAERFAPDRMAVAGDSAGGGLAAALVAELDRIGAPPPACLVGFSGFFDLTLSGASLRRFARRETLLPVARIPEAIETYLGGADPADPRASPLFAPIKRPIPTLLQVGSTEALRDDSLRYAERLRAAGGDVRLEVWRGAPHAFAFFAPFIVESAKAVETAGRFIRERQAAAAAGEPALA